MIRHIYKHKGRFDFEAGGSIDNLEVVYHTSPSGYSPDKKVIWLLHALTASSDAEGEWWPDLVGPGKTIDTDKYFVICANVLGSACGSSGPAQVNPKTGKPYYLDFPKVTVHDTVVAFDLLRESLGIPSLDMVVSTSMGGFMAFEWVAWKPELFSKIFFIATGARVTPWLTGFNSAMKMALLADPTFMERKTLKGGMDGLKAARTIALLTYRCEEGLFKQTEDSEDVMFADKAGSYYRHQSSKFVKEWDAYSYLYVCNEVDSNNVGRGRGGVEKVLGGIKADCCFVCMSSDELFPPEDMKPWSEMVPGARYFLIDTPYGHDGFLIETEKIGEILRPALEEMSQNPLPCFSQR